MPHDPFTHFIHFVECDRALAQNHQEQESVKKELSQLLKEEEEESARIRKLKEHTQALRNEIRTYELEVSSKRSRQKDIQKRLLEVSGAREYTALHNELEEIARSKDCLEDKWLESSQAYEAQEQASAKEQEKSAQWLKAHKQALEAKKASLEALENQRIVLEERCATLRSSVAPEFLEEYTTMKRVVENPVVPVVNLFCSGCNQQITAHDMSSLRRHVLVSCKECYRKLYLPL